MTLEEASVAALQAAQAGDLDALSNALEQRQQALARGEQPTVGVLTSGTLTSQLLRALVLNTRAEQAKLERLWQFVTTPSTSSINIRG